MDDGRESPARFQRRIDNLHEPYAHHMPDAPPMLPALPYAQYDDPAMAGPEAFEPRKPLGLAGIEPNAYAMLQRSQTRGQRDGDEAITLGSMVESERKRPKRMATDYNLPTEEELLYSDLTSGEDADSDRDVDETERAKRHIERLFARGLLAHLRTHQ